MVSTEVEGNSIISRARSSGSSNDCDTLALQGQTTPSVGILPSAAGVSIQDGNVVGICGDSITAGRDVHYHQHHYSSSRSPFHPTNENQEPQRADTLSMQSHRGISSEYTPTPTRPIQRSYDIYRRHLEAKGHGKCLWIPAPSKNLPIQYQRNGIAIGDVGIVHPSGRFIFLFNLCLPKDHPFHPSKMPAGFEPLPSNVIQEFIISEQREFSENSFLASESTVRVTTDGGSTGLVFESSNQDGAILTMPIGAKSEDLENVVLFRKYVLANLASWYRHAYHDRSLDVRNGDLRVVTGSDKTSAWGMATFSHSNSGHSSTGQGSALGVPGSEPKFHLQFGPIANGNVASHRTPKRYVWEYSGAAEVRTGPDATEIAKLRGNNGDDDDDGVYENQSLFIRTLNPTLSKRLWEGLGIDEEEDVDIGWGYGSHSMNGNTTGGPASPAERGGNASNGSQLNQGGCFSPTGSQAHNQAVSSTSFGTGNVGPYRCTTPDHSSSITLADHPSNAINQFLLNNCSGDTAMAVTADQDWIAVLREDDNVLPSSQELLERIREAYDISEEDDIVFLAPKVQTLNRTCRKSSSIVGDNIPEVKPEKPVTSSENLDLDVLARKTPHLSASVSDHTNDNDKPVGGENRGGDKMMVDSVGGGGGKDTGLRMIVEDMGELRDRKRERDRDGANEIDVVVKKDGNPKKTSFIITNGTVGQERAKRQKMADDEDGHTCSDCGTTSTPEWRRGPLGPRTLCNACGLVYAKMAQMIKKRDREKMPNPGKKGGKNSAGANAANAAPGGKGGGGMIGGGPTTVVNNDLTGGGQMHAIRPDGDDSPGEESSANQEDDDYGGSQGRTSEMADRWPLLSRLR